MKKQTILSGTLAYDELKAIMKLKQIKNPLLVCGNSFKTLPSYSIINNMCSIRFTEFTSNPTYNSVCNGVRLFLDEKCDAIIAVGGGSAMDVAKCIKLFAHLDHTSNYLLQSASDNSIPLIVAPTTAGTGSESTHFAVIYHEGEKQSVSHCSIIPDIVILDPSSLATLPIYQKKCTMLDALCQAIESMWSINSTSESIDLSQKAIHMILEHMDSYLANSHLGNEMMQIAANFAGQAINITQTTAPHAMSYKLTSLFKIPHGHAVALCLPHVWSYMLEDLEYCTDSRGSKWLENILLKTAVSMKQETAVGGVNYFINLIDYLNLSSRLTITESQLDILTCSVNIDRLKNNPIPLNESTIRFCYNNIRL